MKMFRFAENILPVKPISLFNLDAIVIRAAGEQIVDIIYIDRSFCDEYVIRLKKYAFVGTFIAIVLARAWHNKHKR